MAFENVRPFRLDTSGFDNALSGLFGAVKQRNDQAEFDAGTVGLIDTLMPNQNALSQPTMAPMQPQQPAILQAGYGRESGPGAVAGGSVYDRIKKFEGYTPKAQWDYQQHSVGYGTKAKYPGEVIDKPEAERRFKAEVDGARAIVEQVAPNAPPGWKDALTSLTYNSGGKWARSGLGAAIQKGDYQEAARIYAQYNKAGGKTLPGLVNRRQEELGWTQGGNGQPVRTADAGGNQQTAVLEWARRNPRHPTAQAILQKYVTQQMDPNADLERMKTEAEIQKLQREAAGGAKYGKQGAIFQDPVTKKFYSVQFSESGERLIEPLDGLAPSRGVGEVDTGTGTQIIDKATGLPVREVPKNLAEAESQKAIGKQQGENAANQPKAQASLQSANAKTGLVLGAIQDAKKLTSGWSVGAGSLLSSLPGTQARDLRARVDTILANLGFEELQDMRNNSPTGGALGAIAVQELQMLQSTKVSLDQAQTVDQFISALSRLESILDGAQERRQAAYEATYGSPPKFNTGPARPADKASYDALPRGTRYVAPDGSERVKP